MGYQRYALLLDHADGALGGAAMQLLSLGVDVLYVNDPDEAALMARQEADHIGSVIVPSGSSLGLLDRVIEQICSQIGGGTDGLVLVGPEPDPDVRQSLKRRGIRWGVFEPFEQDDLRFVTTAVMAISDPNDPRKALRVPTDIPAVVCMGRHRKEVRVHDLSVTGAYLAAEHPFLEGSALSVDIPLPDRALWAKAEVLRAKTADKPGRADVPEGMGVVFTEIAEDAKDALQAYVAEIVKRFQV